MNEMGIRGGKKKKRKENMKKTHYQHQSYTGHNSRLECIKVFQMQYHQMDKDLKWNIWGGICQHYHQETFNLREIQEAELCFQRGFSTNLSI